LVEIIFNDSLIKEQLYPFAQIRNAADIRVGILTIREKWDILKIEKHFDTLILPGILNSSEIRQVQTPLDIVSLNDWALRQDFELLTRNRKSALLSSTNKIISPENIFLEEGATVEYSILNASMGPVYIGKNAEIMEGSMIRGPFALCEGAKVKMGSKIYGATTIGPYSVAGGEIKNSVIFGYSNKAHDGYLGDSVLGEWCNLGAGTTNSNVKNTAGEVRVWNYANKAYESAGLKFGLIMGDYSRAAINTSFNTGTVVGVCCNIFNEGFPPKYIPDFTWGKEKYDFEKAIKDIDNWKKLKGKNVTEHEKETLKKLYNNK
jgi:UDP-N-acetylglucosamine diphosphorylase/glucosamine-1-phosphate N-acetyltransferase